MTQPTKAHTVGQLQTEFYAAFLWSIPHVGTQDLLTYRVVWVLGTYVLRT